MTGTIAMRAVDSEIAKTGGVATQHPTDVMKQTYAGTAAAENASPAAATEERSHAA